MPTFVSSGTTKCASNSVLPVTGTSGTALNFQNGISLGQHKNQILEDERIKYMSSYWTFDNRSLTGSGRLSLDHFSGNCP